MRRRTLLALLGSAGGVGWPSFPWAQPARVARLGVLHSGGRDPVFDRLFKSLGERGWVEGRNLVIDFYTLDPGATDAAREVREMLRLKCDVILANGTPAALAVHAGAPQVPMVFLIGGDPVALGLVKSLRRPGGHATGYMQQSFEIAAKQLSLLRELAPAARRIAVMFEAGNPSMLQGLRTAETAAKPLGLSVRRVPLRDWRDVDAAHKAWLHEPVDGLLVLFDRVTGGLSWDITTMASRLRLPAVYGSRLFVENNVGTVAYGIDSAALVIGSADYLARILDGTKPADLPVQQPSRFELVVNLHNADAFGIDVPQSVLLQATEVIR